MPENQRKYSYVERWSLEHGKVVSCGCYAREKTSETFSKQRKFNQYDLTGEYGIGITDKGDKFIFDIEDYELISHFCWSRNSSGYFRTHILNYNRDFVPAYITSSDSLYLHRLIIQTDSNNFDVDHINGMRWDNRKRNLRLVTRSENLMNAKIRCTNSSGHKGVSFYKSNGKWRSWIIIESQNISLGYYDDYEDAVQAREAAEKKYFGEYARAPEFLNNGKESEMGGG